MERFGNYVTFDAMKRELNTELWPYLSPTIVNDCGESQVVIECLAVGERHSVYSFMIEHLLLFTPSTV